ncbi:PROTEIN BIG GRAIN 1-LIKE B [Salix koriyanagi]|uniref:PROTEIN BIG GRAIN 1-LIKE B n=1 Tax=Salix koriyanagi TaxID=2511006 RepID=A0A9Q0PXA8_9ROSI|nr:PROTEIN BIG GRAIN 1-LIKE B [Salix koriyanagi]
MDRWEKPLRDDRYRHQRESPSFSSTLLDSIYRSIDETGSGKGEEEQLIYYRETMRKKHENNGMKDEAMASLQRACMIERWMEKKVSHEKVAVRRESMADFENKSRKDVDSVLLNSSSSSSESSCGGGFSSSESESIYGTVNSSRSSTTSYTMQRPRPIRASISARPEKYQRREDHHQTDVYHNHERNYAPSQKAKHEGSFIKTKSKALKIYGDLKKVKQPISPGGRLASFLNSLFTTGNAKKAKISTSGGGRYEERKFKSEQASTCSSASSFSRSCLSKTPASRGGKLSSSSSGVKRSVRFYPVSVIVDEDCRPCGHKSLYGGDCQELSATLVAATAIADTRNKVPTSDEELKFHVTSENRRIEDVARNLLKNYQKNKEEQFDHMSADPCNDINEVIVSSEEEEEEEESDVASCASSDLFELDNLSVIGIERYREELPVYETTHLGTNRAIANGLIL